MWLYNVRSTLRRRMEVGDVDLVQFVADGDYLMYGCEEAGLIVLILEFFYLLLSFFGRRQIGWFGAQMS